MLTEAQLDHFEYLVDAYAAVKAYWGKVEELESQIQDTFLEMAQDSPTFDSVQSILGRQVDYKHLVPSRVAWVLQHGFDCRAACVRNRYVYVRESRGETSFGSPLLEQIKLASQSPATLDLGSIARQRSARKARKIIDSFLIDAPNSVCYVAIGQTLESAKKLYGAARAEDYSMSFLSTTDREIHGVSVAASDLLGLDLARELLSEALPSFKIIPLVVVIDDVQTGRGFQVHDLSPYRPSTKAQGSICLDDYDVAFSSRAWVQSGRDLDELEQVPAWPTSDLLHNVPVDRASRCAMMLNCLWEAQDKRPSTLYARTWSQLGGMAERQYRIAFSKDLRRHDVEAGLERAKYIERLTYDPTQFALTPRGVARAILMRRLFSRVSQAEFDNGISINILGAVHQQADLWRRYREGVVG